jgi:hypothetical protein
MSRNLYYVAIAFFGMLNGIPFFHPMYIVAFGYSIKLMAAPLFGNTSLVAYFASLMLSTVTIALGGIPAAIYERIVGTKDDSTEVSLWIWLTATALLTLPAVGNFLKVGL